MLDTRRSLLLLGTFAWSVGAARAQDFNLDVGPTSQVGLPSDAYGAGANRPGRWFALTGDPPYAFTLEDIDGNPTAVTSQCVVTGNGQGDFYFDNLLSTGDDEKLIDDLQDVGCCTATALWTFSGLQDGAYHVYTYAIAPDDAGARTLVTPEGTTETVVVGGVFPNGQQQGSTYAFHCVEVTGGVLQIRLDAGTGFASCNGFQLVYHGPGCIEQGTPYCECTDGTLSPCGNPGAPDHGCANSGQADGAHLFATGTLNPDTLVLHASGAIPSQPGLFFQGDSPIGGGAGVTFGDGLRCAGGSVKRLEVAFPDATGLASTTVSISAAGGVGPGSGHRYYQFWYRDPTLGPCGSGFNLTNGLAIIW
jgi:hypothetical protein